MPARQARGHRALRLGARRVHDPHQTEKRHVLFGVGERGGRFPRDRQHAKAFGRHPSFGLLDDAANRRCERGGVRPVGPERTVFRDDVGGALRVRHPLPSHLVQRRHPPPLGREWNFLEARSLVVHRGVVEAALGGGHDERALGGIAFDPPLSLVVHEPCVGREHAPAQQFLERRIRTDRVGFFEKLADRIVAGTRHADRSAGDEQLANRHLVLRERSGLVGTDDRRAAKRFDDGQPADERVALHHPAHADREGDGHDGGKRFGHDGHGERNAEDEHVEQRLSTPHTERHDHRHDDECGLAERVAQLVQVLLERCASGFDGLHELRDLAELRRHAGLNHDCVAAAVRHERPRVRHVAPIADRESRIDERGACFLDGGGFTGERRFVDRQVHGEGDACVGGHTISGVKCDEIARDELARCDGPLGAVPDRMRERRRHFP